MQHLHLLVAHVVGGEGHRRLHAEERQQLHHVVLDQVAHGARLVVVLGPGAHAQVLRRGDLHVVDEVAVPDRLEQPVGEPQGHQVLDRLLAQVVVDAEDLLLAQHAQELLVQVDRLGQVGADRLLDHHPHLGVVLVVQPVLAELVHDHGEERRRRGEVEDAVEDDLRRLVELLRRLLHLLVCRVLVEGAGHVAHVLEEPVQHLLIRLPAGELHDRLLGDLPVLVMRHVAAGHPDQVEALRKRALVREVVERRQELALGQVARAAEDHERGGMNRQPLEALDERVLLLPLRGLAHDTFSTACPPNWLRRAASTLAVYSPPPRLVKRANRAAVITGTGTSWSMASSIVQRPSPESFT